MRCLTLHQPWASLIAMGLKKYETRPRKLSHRGPIGIHAGLKFADPGILDSLKPNMPFSHRHSLDQEFPHGVIVAIADMTDCVEMTEDFINSQTTLEKMVGNWEVGRWGYKLENVRILDEPVKAKGSQGLWTLDDSLVSDYL